MNKLDFKRWYDDYQKKEIINNPAGLYACLKYNNWEDNIDIIKENAWNECKQFGYATKKQFNEVFNAKHFEKGETQKLAEELMEQLFKTEIKK